MSELIMQSRVPNNKLGSIIGQIRYDIANWEDIHGEPPGKIFLSIGLYLMIKETARWLTCYVSLPGTAEERLFGIVVSKYSEIGSIDTLAYHLAAKERRFTFGEEDTSNGKT